MFKLYSDTRVSYFLGVNFIKKI